MAAHRIPYVATASPAFLDDLKGKVERAKAIRGLRFMHLFSPCPPGWKSDPADSIAIARLAVESNVFPLYEVYEGERLRLTCQSSSVPVAEYLKLQGRFKYMSEREAEDMQRAVERSYAALKLRHEKSKVCL